MVSFKGGFCNLALGGGVGKEGWRGAGEGLGWGLGRGGERVGARLGRVLLSMLRRPRLKIPVNVPLRSLSLSVSDHVSKQRRLGISAWHTCQDLRANSKGRIHETQITSPSKADPSFRFLYMKWAHRLYSFQERGITQGRNSIN